MNINRGGNRSVLVLVFVIESRRSRKRIGEKLREFNLGWFLGVCVLVLGSTSVRCF